MKGLSSEGGTDEDSGDIPAGISFSELCLSQEHPEEPFGVQPEAEHLGSCLLSQPGADPPQAGSLPELSPEGAPEGEAGAATGPGEHQDKLYLHLKENLGKVKEFVMDMGRRIPIPEQCVIEGKQTEPPKDFCTHPDPPQGPKGSREPSTGREEHQLEKTAFPKWNLLNPSTIHFLQGHIPTSPRLP